MDKVVWNDADEEQAQGIKTRKKTNRIGSI